MPFRVFLRITGAIFLFLIAACLIGALAACVTPS